MLYIKAVEWILKSSHHKEKKVFYFKNFLPELDVH